MSGWLSRSDRMTSDPHFEDVIAVGFLTANFVKILDQWCPDSLMNTNGAIIICRTIHSVCV